MLRVVRPSRLVVVVSLFVSFEQIYYGAPDLLLYCEEGGDRRGQGTVIAWSTTGMTHGTITGGASVGGGVGLGVGGGLHHFRIPSP